MIKLFVVGYPLDIEEAELRELFGMQGSVHSIELITDGYTNRHKGFGFVEMEDQEGADRAIRTLNGRILNGRKLVVKLADEDRAEKPRAVKPNRFFDREGEATQSTAVPYRTKRPRKLLSNTLKTGA